jgi:hypothetical protein
LRRAWLGTTGSKSCLNFLALLRAGHDDYVINAEALAYMRERALATHVIARLIEHPDRCFAGHDAWNAHLEALGVSALKVNPDPVVVARQSSYFTLAGAGWMQHGSERDTSYFAPNSGFGASDRLSCPACSGTMTISRRTPVDNLPNFELQTFSCHQCGNEWNRTVDQNGKPPR